MCDYHDEDDIVAAPKAPETMSTTSSRRPVDGVVIRPECPGIEVDEEPRYGDR